MSMIINILVAGALAILFAKLEYFSPAEAERAFCFLTIILGLRDIHTAIKENQQ